ncbi:PAS-domain containing protein [Oceaniglobus ichthyenteri]|uniref:PAS-domain containing protein n=1 Tax=Oceaniglobus ichthyenteri TaxID=2136177 RepID=UPI000D3917A5|nr:PAS-domain containing protein [Oceaniglobus ichthyenteri]
MDTATLLANERRARLAAERLLEMRQRELKSANKKLADHARALTGQIVAKREEMEMIQTQTEDLHAEYDQVRTDLARANSEAELAQGRLWSALQSVRDGFAVFDDADKLVVANKAYLAIFDGLDCVRPGISYREITHILVEEGIIDPQGPADAWIDAMLRRWQDDQPESMILRLWNGQFVKLMDRRTPEGGTVTLGINQTDQLRMWAAVETIPDGFVLFDQEDRMVMCNAQYRTMYDMSDSDVPYGTTFEAILRFSMARGQIADALGREEQWLEERMSEHRRADGVVEQQLADGRWLRILEQATPDGGRVGLRMDITEIKKQHAALEAERQRAEAANRAKSAFLANMSHEIRTPMNGVVGMADLLSGSALTPEQTLYVDTIRTSGATLLATLNDILDFSKIEANHTEMLSAPFNLEDCLLDVVRLLKPTISGQPIKLLASFHPDQPIMVNGDGGRVRQILTNLLGNALKFTEAGRVAIRVTPAPGTTVRIEVSDTGIGIPEDKLEHIFGEFNQVEDDRNRSFDGTGLGLAICRQLVALMGGTIAVTSTLGKGSCFTVDLPLGPADKQPEAVKLHDHLEQVHICGPKGEIRDDLAAHLAHLGLTVRIDETPPRSMPADSIVLSLSDGQGPSGQGASVLITCDPALNVTGQDGFAKRLVYPVPRGVLVETLNALADLAQPAAAKQAAPGPIHVLAAEDNRTNQLVLEKMLKTANIDLQIVSNGADAVEAFIARQPQLIFMDISMPGMDGREAARRIRAHEAEQGLPHTPIVAMTAHAMDSDKKEIAAAGIDHHLSKPLSRAALVGHIETVRGAGQGVT